MKVGSMVAMKASRNGGRFLGRVAFCCRCRDALADPGCGAWGGSVRVRRGGKNPAVTIENIPGSTAPRVILTAKAAERLGIETGKVAEERIVRKQMVGGLLLPPVEKRPVADTQPVVRVWRFREERAPPLPEPSRRGDIARGWRRLGARDAFPRGVGKAGKGQAGAPPAPVHARETGKGGIGTAFRSGTD